MPYKGSVSDNNKVTNAKISKVIRPDYTIASPGVGMEVEYNRENVNYSASTLQSTAVIFVKSQKYN